MVHHMAVIIGVWLVLHFQGRFMFFCDFSLHFRTLHTSCKHILGPGYPQSKRVDSVSRDLDSNGCGIFLCRILPIWWFWMNLIAVLMDPASTIVLWYVRVWTVFTYIAFDMLNILWFGKCCAVKSLQKISIVNIDS